MRFLLHSPSLGALFAAISNALIFSGQRFALAGDYINPRALLFGEV